MLEAVRAALSKARMQTYELVSGTDDAALVLYAWNAQVSGAFLSPLHVCEVVVRNAVADAIEGVYGHRWPWSATFEYSLPDPTQGYSPRRDLQSARRNASSTGKVIPELKFVFWQKMFTGRYDSRIWNPHLRRVMPNLDSGLSVAVLRQGIYRDLEQLRFLRNRIAHHEPIFTRSLLDDYQKIRTLVGHRCAVTARWMDENQQATSVIAAKPKAVEMVGV